jgi:hypothetical protein
MADTKLSELTELAATPAADDEAYIRDVSEAAADESKRITIANLLGSAIAKSLLTTQGDIIKRGASIPERHGLQYLRYCLFTNDDADDIIWRAGFPIDEVSLHVDWKTIDVWNFGGLGTGNWIGLGSYELQTGAVNDRYKDIYTLIGDFYLYLKGELLWTKLQAATALATSEIFFGAIANTRALPIVWTEKHIGWKILNGQIWASNADGTTETATDTGVSIATQWDSAKLMILVTADNTVKFFVNDVLKATHTTNIPSGGNYNMEGYIKTTAAVDRRFRIYTVNYLGKI